MDVTPYANVDSSVSFFTYSDVDIFLSYSNGSAWVDAGNITNTPSGYDDAGNYLPKFELHPHLQQYHQRLILLVHMVQVVWID